VKKLRRTGSLKEENPSLRRRRRQKNGWRRKPPSVSINRKLQLVKLSRSAGVLRRVQERGTTSIAELNHAYFHRLAHTLGNS
jgi:hypothetical protein